MRKFFCLFAVLLVPVLALAQRPQLSIEWAVKDGPKAARG
jgi:hypothetical protein